MLRMAGIVALLATLAPFSIDTYLPSFPAIGRELQMDAYGLQLTLSLYLAGFSVSTLVHGPLSDRFGRRSVAMGGLMLYIAASVLCLLAQETATLYLGRILQGVSASAGVVIGRAMVRDAYSGPQAQRVMSQVMLLFAVAPAVAPVVGGYLEAWFGWRGVFAFLVLLGVALLGLVQARLPETLPLSGRQPVHPAAVARTYLAVARSRRFLGLVAVLALNFGGFFLYVAASPAIIYRHLGFGPSDFGVLFVPVVGGLMLGALLSGRAAGRLHPTHTIGWGFVLMGCAAAANLAQAALLAPHPAAVVGPVVVYAVGVSLSMPALSLLALEAFPTHRGTASAVQTFVQTLTNALVAGAAVAPLSQSLLWLAAGMALFLCAGALTWAAMRRSVMP